MRLGWDLSCSDCFACQVSIEAMIYPHRAQLWFHPLAWGLLLSIQRGSVFVIVGPFSATVSVIDIVADDTEAEARVRDILDHHHDKNP